MREHQGLEACIADPVDAQVEGLQVWQLRVCCDDRRAEEVDVIRAQVYLLDVLQVVRREQQLHAVVAQIIPRQLQLLDVLEEIDPRQVVEVPVRQLRHVLGLERPDLFGNRERADLVEDAILLLVVEEEVQIDCEGADILVVLEYGHQEFVLVAGEEVERLLRNADLLRPLEELDAA